MGLLFAVFIDQHRFEAQGPSGYLMHDTITYQWDLSWWAASFPKLGYGSTSRCCTRFGITGN
jgi:hypothetical protein